MDGHIPVGLGDLPIDTTPLDESSVYTGILKRATLSPKRDKNDNVYCALQIEVAGGDFDGTTVMMNYLPLPVPLTPDMTKGEMVKAKNRAVSFARFARAFKITGDMPSVQFGDAESMSNWQDWISQYYESEGKFTVRNQEFPEGSGRLRSGIADFVF